MYSECHKKKIFKNDKSNWWLQHQQQYCYYYYYHQHHYNKSNNNVNNDANNNNAAADDNIKKSNLIETSYGTGNINRNCSNQTFNGVLEIERENTAN